MKEIQATAPHVFSMIKLLFSPGKGHPRLHVYTAKKVPADWTSSFLEALLGFHSAADLFSYFNSKRHPPCCPQARAPRLWGGSTGTNPTTSPCRASGRAPPNDPFWGFLPDGAPPPSPRGLPPRLAGRAPTCQQPLLQQVEHGCRGGSLGLVDGEEPAEGEELLGRPGRHAAATRLPAGHAPSPPSLAREPLGNVVRPGSGSSFWSKKTRSPFIKYAVTQPEVKAHWENKGWSPTGAPKPGHSAGGW